MQIIIPMSGIGKRFIDDGYIIPKPLIVVNDEPIINHVINLFPHETKFHFICNDSHLSHFPMREILLKKVPSGSIHSVSVNNRKGPVDAVLQISDSISDDDEVIVSYCDYGTEWDYKEFLRDVRSNNVDGAIAAYVGFHPHMLGSDNYAFMTHVNKWVNVKVTDTYSQPAPIVEVDAVRYWTPTPDKSVDFTEVKDYILSLKTRGFNIAVCTFDRWNSHDMMQQLKQYGINTEILSVAKKHYDDMAMVVAEERLIGPHIPLLIDELCQLRIMRDKVDHPRKGSKDLADATCGAIFNSISRTRFDNNQEINVHTYESMSYDNDFKKDEDGETNSYNMIRPPRMPENLREAMDRMQII